MIRVPSILVLALLGSLSAAAEFIPNRYIVELAGEPALAVGVSSGKGPRSAAPDRLSAVRSVQARVRSAAEERGLRVRSSVENVVNVLVVEGTEAEAASLAGLPGVLRVKPVRVFKRFLDHAVVLQKVTDAWQLIGGAENAGSGMKIGVIDTGIDTMHPGLQDPQLTTPDGFPKVNVSSDIANTNGKVIVARNYDESPLASARDIEGHGTGVAMVAAGHTAFGPAGPISGIAPKAYLGNYKVFPDEDEGAPEDAILRAIDDAVMDGMDVINLSLGSYPAEDPEEDVTVRAVERAFGAGVLVVVAAGNEGPDAGTIASPATAPSVISVGNAYTDRIFSASVKYGQVPFIAIAAAGSGSRSPVSAPLKAVADLDTNGLACAELPPDSLRGQVALILRGTCVFESKLRNAELAGAMAAVVYSDAERPEPSDMNPGNAQLGAVMVSHVDGLDLLGRLKAEPQTRVTLTFTRSPVAVDAARLNRSSSRGPSVDFALKPELLAVGTSVYTAGPGSENGTAVYVAASGTSFSAPMVAGALAVLKAARPGLTNQQYRSLVINSTASFPTGSATSGSVMQTGAGLLNLNAAIKSTVVVMPQVLGFGASSYSENLSRTLTVSNAGQSSDTFSISVVPVKGSSQPEVQQTQVELAPGASQDVQVRFLPSGDGELYGHLLVRSSSGDSEARIPYWFGAQSQTVSRFTIIDMNPSEDEVPDSRQIYVVRPTDGSGLAVEVDPKITVVTGDGKVAAVGRMGVYPGFYYLDLRMGPIAGENTFVLEAGGVTQRLTVITQ